MKTRTLSIPDFRRFDRMLPVMLIIAVLLVTGLPGFAAEHPEQDAQLAVKTGVEFQPRLGEYHYEIQWGQQRVAMGIIAIRQDGDQYVLTADQRTTKFIDRIYRVRYRGETRINAVDLTPAESVIEGEVRKRKTVQKAKYDAESGSVSVEETRTKGKAAAKTKTYELQSDTGILDLFSAIFLARSFDWSIGERHGFLLFIGDKQYTVTMDCIGKSTFEIEDDSIPVWVIQPRIQRTTEDKPSSVARKTRIFIAADESKDIVKVETEPGIGTVTLRLMRYLEHESPGSTSE